MRTPKYTPLRHRMLQAMADGRIILECVNVKRALWKPRDLRYLGQRLNLSAAEAGTINDFGPCGGVYAHTPNWQGDMDVVRAVELREPGRALLAEWTVEHGPVPCPERGIGDHDCVEHEEQS